MLSFSPGLILCSAYTEPFPLNPISGGLSAEEDHGRTSEEEEGVGEPSYDRQVSYRIQINETRVESIQFIHSSELATEPANQHDEQKKKNAARTLMNVLLQ